ncbi:uncharacterized protein LOC132270869 [Cornus florida]|uniref:uncharacterized protein LOC132270869 n=1 Tax=Cornus florida TaxID=4283 RepID=UPI0028A16F74|nr:uncharacterized protein LOC132270869 [Cornus florida]
MENTNRVVGSSSSFTLDLFGPKEPSSSSELFGSVFGPPSMGAGKHSSHAGIVEPLRKQDLGIQYGNAKHGTPVQERRLSKWKQFERRLERRLVAGISLLLSPCLCHANYTSTHHGMVMLQSTFGFWSKKMVTILKLKTAKILLYLSFLKNFELCKCIWAKSSVVSSLCRKKK